MKGPIVSSGIGAALLFIITGDDAFAVMTYVAAVGWIVCRHIDEKYPGGNP